MTAGTTDISRQAGRSPLWSGVLVALIAVIVFELWYDWSRLVPENEFSSDRNPSLDMASSDGSEISRETDIADYLQAPIFLASREAITLPSRGRQLSGAVAVRASELELVGTILSDGEPVALIRILPDGQVMRVRAGDELNGWFVLSIEDWRVRIENSDEIFTLYLDEENRGAATDADARAATDTNRSARTGPNRKRGSGNE